MKPITEKEYTQLAEYIRNNYGINLKEEKKTLVTGRLNNVLIQYGFESFTEYYDFLMRDKSGEGVKTLLNKITTNHTFFMREVNHFYYFRDYTLPMLKEKVTDKDLRIWSAGCSSGEEPYTLAMLIDEYLGKDALLWDAKILATDISSFALDKAKKGIYTNEEVHPLPPAWKLNYLKKMDHNHFVITDKIKKEIIYRKFNLMEETFPFKRKFHVIFCRNVMIYFDVNTKRNLIQKFYESLEYGGYLFIGHSETIDRDESPFKYVIPSVYRKGEKI
ncbi:CheR family methyltransferase [Konateibacter massiliensis]|uniref:CheR family methyltransferase n=1 Tax=Konateibacter massiliensis TaxID=2002841 RepID=UPI000C144AF4|nr:protein-glutamate O-methyltransferase CheR [Konateibacter massiliensis]